MNDTATSKRDERQAFYDAIAPHHLAPLWESLHQLVSRTPATPTVPAHWDYDAVVRPYLMQSGGLITAKEAERRVLILENPGLPGQAAITRSLYAGLQLILPGEVAPAHRHSQSALRFIIEGHGAYTAVEGERALMEPGDFVITPAWTWHDHGNETATPMVWLDGLDIPLVRMFDASFAEPAHADSQAVARPPGDSLARFGHNMLPVDWRPSRPASPVFSYPYARSREALAQLARNGAPDACHGHKLRYVNPASGGAPMPTIGAFLQLLPGGFATAPYRSTDGTVFSVVEGEGETIIGDTAIRWKPRDVFVVPAWHRHTHHAAREAVLFSFSDRPVQEVLGLWREARG
ncbi:MAG: gentisate 1,2-dioxygenase [Rhodospirillales bacterium]|jgi:gentisate 1,2-dioxygenase|nr:gentisate 1,2-dioxygenase [Rhodospirillales bacterium]